MATTRHAGTSEWFREWSKPGLRVLYMANYSLGNAFFSGAFWNDHDAGDAIDTTPSRFPLKDISNRPTSMGLRTLTAVTNQLAAGTYTDIHGYNDDMWDRPYYTDGTATVEIYGIPKDHIVDLVLGGKNFAANDRGGTYKITPDNRQPEVVQGDTGWSGPVMFRGIEPVSGSIQIQFDMVTNFCYWSFFDLRAYRR